MKHLHWMAALCMAAPAAAQNGHSFLGAKRAKVAYTNAATAPAVSCASLISLTGHDYSILAAGLVAATAEAPEHCRVAGVIPPEIRFEVNLPSLWNRRLYMYGNGGYAGTPPDHPSRNGPRNNGLRHGFATTYTDTGHDRHVEPLGEFAHNNLQKLVDYSFRAVHLTVLASKEIVRTYYGGETAAYSYWDGCSTGGREGLMSAQRFPRDFDGIVAGAPVLNFSGTMIGYIWKLHALEAAPLSLAKIEQVGKAVYARCDAVDGLKDGLITDPRDCDFDPARDLPRCGAGQDSDCFTAAEIGALKKIYSDVTGGGRTLFPHQPVGAELGPPSGSRRSSGWDRWIINENGPSIGQVFSETFLQYLAYPEDDPNRDWESFDFDKDPQRMELVHSMLDATNPDLSAFQHRGGKIIMYFGWADAALNPLMGLGYYEDVLATMGADTQDFFRLYMVPGMYHCGGGLGVDRIDAMTPLIDWVEGGPRPTRSKPPVLWTATSKWPARSVPIHRWRATKAPAAPTTQRTSPARPRSAPAIITVLA